MTTNSIHAGAYFLSNSLHSTDRKYTCYSYGLVRIAHVLLVRSRIVSCPAGLALMRKHRLVTMLEFLGPGSAIQPKYWLANQNDELHNRMNVLEVDKKADDLKPFIRSYSPRLFKLFVVKFFFPISPYES